MTFPTPADGQDGKDGFSPIVSLTPREDNSGATLEIITDTEGNKVQYNILNGTNGIDGVNGISIINVEVDDNNHLICTLSDNSTIDAGEIKINAASEVDGSGGLEQYDQKASFPQEGEENKLYLAKDTHELYYWDGEEYKLIAGENGSCECPDLDYVTKEDIDEMFKDNPLIPDLGGNSCECPNIDYVTKEDIDKMFENNPIIPDLGENGDGYDIIYVTKEDIDKMFGDLNNPNLPELPDNSYTFATKEDIDKMFL